VPVVRGWGWWLLPVILLHPLDWLRVALGKERERKKI